MVLGALSSGVPDTVESEQDPFAVLVSNRQAMRWTFMEFIAQRLDYTVHHVIEAMQGP